MLFLRLVSRLCFTFAGLSFALGLLNVAFGTKIGFRFTKTALPSDFAGVFAVSDAIAIIGVLTGFAAGPRAALHWARSNKLIVVTGFLVMIVLPLGFVASLAAQPEPIGVAIRKDVAQLDAAIARGGDVNQADARGQTLLIHAMSQSSPEVIDRLLDRGARVDAKDQFGMTALMHCLAYRRRGVDDHVHVLKALLARGADASAVDARGKTVAAYADAAAKDLPGVLEVFRSR